MSETLERVDTSTLLAIAHAAVDTLINTGASSGADDLSDVLRSLEQLRRKLPAEPRRLGGGGRDARGPTPAGTGGR